MSYLSFPDIETQFETIIQTVNDTMGEFDAHKSPDINVTVVTNPIHPKKSIDLTVTSRDITNYSVKLNIHAVEKRTDQYCWFVDGAELMQPIIPCLDSILMSKIACFHETVYNIVRAQRGNPALNTLWDISYYPDTNKFIINPLKMDYEDKNTVVVEFNRISSFSQPMFGTMYSQSPRRFVANVNNYNEFLQALDTQRTRLGSAFVIWNELHRLANLLEHVV